MRVDWKGREAKLGALEEVVTVIWVREVVGHGEGSVGGEATTNSGEKGQDLEVG